MSGEGEVAESKPKSKITLFIICHGADKPDNKIASDPSVRILSQAGKFGCWGFSDNISLDLIKRLISDFKFFDTYHNDFVSTYYILIHLQHKLKLFSDLTDGEYLKKYLKGKYLTDADNDQRLKGSKTINYRQSIHTEKTRESNKDWQIYTPIMDHMYDFTDKTQRDQGIFIVDIINKPESFTLEVDDDLLRHIMKFTVKVKDEFKKMTIKDFFKENSIFENDKEKEGEVLKSFVARFNLEYLEDYVYCLTHTNMIPLLIEILGRPIFNKIKLLIHEKYVEREYSFKVLQSELIKFLKDEGFDIINIIDKSCRAYGSIMSKDQFALISANEDKASESIDERQGGKKQTRKRRKKKQRKFKTKSQRKSKTTL